MLHAFRLCESLSHHNYSLTLDSHIAFHLEVFWRGH